MTPTPGSSQGYGALLQGRPEDCLRWTAAADGTGEAVRVVPGLDVLRAAARFDLGEHGALLGAITAARCGAGGGPVLDRPTLALAAAVEHGAATALGMRAHARAVAEWAEDELGGTGDVLVMQAWGPAMIGRDDAARERLRACWTVRSRASSTGCTRRRSSSTARWRCTAVLPRGRGTRWSGRWPSPTRPGRCAR